MSKTQVKPETPVYQLKMTLNGSKPPIWRRVLVPGDITLGELHDVIQIAMGWEDGHLHQFTVGGLCYSNPFFGLAEYVGGVKDENRAVLSRVAPGEKFRFVYEYDFGDSWKHVILVEKILPPDPQQKLPVCIKGKRACPPEDVGGIWGYYGFLAALQDPDHPERDDYLEWIGGEWDAEAFDLNAINQGLGATP